MTSNKKTVILVLVVLAVMLGLVCLLCTKVLRGEKEPTQVKYDDPVQARMHDEKYVAKLNEQLESRKEILKGLSAAKTKLNAAKAKLEEAKNAKASDEEIAKLSAEVAACNEDVQAWAKNFENHQRLSEKIVRDQMWKSGADQQQQLQQKGN